MRITTATSFTCGSMPPAARRADISRRRLHITLSNEARRRIAAGYGISAGAAFAIEQAGSPALPGWRKKTPFPLN
ncbi:hypothetical protein [Noviherbaspirillum soli]|uniref:hypothetical protein n=1 Tax=Noviherbaspirillum soli TaxID=1064518 RepID=UPI00188CB40F|nr:hypothetical protein [Noviherbaspirillum soli]